MIIKINDNDIVDRRIRDYKFVHSRWIEDLEPDEEIGYATILGNFDYSEGLDHYTLPEHIGKMITKFHFSDQLILVRKDSQIFIFAFMDEENAENNMFDGPDLREYTVEDSIQYFFDNVDDWY